MTALSALPTTEQIRNAWDTIAPNFDRYTTSVTATFTDEILDRVDPAPGVRLLDVGCGSGAVALAAARRGAKVLAVDLAPKMIELLEERARDKSVTGLKGRVMDGQNLDLHDDAFDVTTSLNGVSLFPDLVRGLGEMVRVTKPGGRVVVAAFGALEKAEFITLFVRALKMAEADFRPPPMDPPPLPFQVADPTKLREALAGAGLGSVEVDTVTWHMAFESAREFFDVVRSSNPIGAQMVAGLNEEQIDQVHRVIDRIFRERSNGSAGAVLTTEMNVGVGTVQSH